MVNFFKIEKHILKLEIDFKLQYFKVKNNQKRKNNRNLMIKMVLKLRIHFLMLKI